MRILLFTTLLALAAGASADTLTNQMHGCAAIENDSERLSCYDALSKTLDRRAEDNFGQEQKRIAEEAPDSISATVSKIQEGSYGKVVVTLHNGQVWRQNDSGRVHWDQGEQVLIERGVFGSFFMKSTEGGRKIRVKRVK